MSTNKNDVAKDPTTASLDQIRNILTGDQERETQRRFKLVEERFGKEVQSLQTSFGKRVDELSAEYDAEMEALQAELEAAVAGSGRIEKGQALKTSEMGKALDAKLAKLSERVTRLTKQLGEDFKVKQKTLRDELTARLDELSEEVDTGFEELRATMVDKEELSGFFAEFALKLVNRKQIRLNQ